MNSLTIYLAVVLLTSAGTGFAQGTFVYDQQSANETARPESEAIIPTSSPVGQSFTPSLSGVGFVRFYVADRVSNGLGATLRVDLLAESFSNGTVLASSQPVAMPDRYFGFTDFFFAGVVPVTPGVQYFFKVVADSGELWGIGWDSGYNYAGGTAYAFGLPAPPRDLWFREGIIIPEPSLISLALAGMFMALSKMKRARGLRDSC